MSSHQQLVNLAFKTEKLKLRKNFFLQCIEHKVLPRGLRLKFNISSDALNPPTLESDISNILQQSSSRILDRLLDETNACLQHKLNRMTEMSHPTDHNEHHTSRIRLPLSCLKTLKKIRSVHNSKLQKLLLEKQSSATNAYVINPHQPPFVRRVRPSRRIQRNKFKKKKNNLTPSDSKLVVTVPDSLQLSEPEKSILGKGLKFIPLQRTYNHQKAMEDTHRFMRLIRLKHYFHNSPQQTTQETPFSLFKQKSSWTPPSGQSLVLDYFVQKTVMDLNKIKSHPLKKRNISLDEAAALNSLKNRKDVVIKPADKGGAVVVWEKNAYIAEANRQLSDTTFYAPSAQDKTVSNNTTVKTTVTKLIENESLPEEANSLVLQPSQLGKPCFYMLPKIHKMTYPTEMPIGRPIVSAISCPTEKISQFLDSIFQPIVSKLPTYVKDTNHALQILQDVNRNLHIPELLFSMDVTALYTSIPHHDGLKAIKHFFTLDPHPTIPIESILRLTELVLNLNSFEFNGNHFHQISGVAMGTKMGPSYANLFMGHLEQNIVRDYRGPSPEHLHRYIDDYVGATDMSEDNLKDFFTFANGYHPSIKFTYSISSESLSFLDIKIIRTDTELNTTVHYKPTDSHNFLSYSSSHPVKCKDSIPFSQLLRLRRLCNTTEAFEDEKERMLDFFRDRGYPEAVLNKAKSRVSLISREDALKKKGGSNHQRPVLAITYHPHAKAYRDIILKNYQKILQADNDLKNIFNEPPMIAWRRDKSIRDLLVHSRITSVTHGCMLRCGRSRCDTCPHLYQHPNMDFPLGSKPVVQASCTERNVVYGIKCASCGSTYIGQTGKRLGDRVVQHLRDIRLDNGKPVARHFNMSGHRGGQDLQVAVLLILGTTEANRRKQESHLIQSLGTYPFGINEKNDIV